MEPWWGRRGPAEGEDRGGGGFQCACDSTWHVGIRKTREGAGAHLLPRELAKAGGCGVPQAVQVRCNLALQFPGSLGFREACQQLLQHAGGTFQRQLPCQLQDALPRGYVQISACMRWYPSWVSWACCAAELCGGAGPCESGSLRDRPGRGRV